jgi:hypothetical protein
MWHSTTINGQQNKNTDYKCKVIFNLQPQFNSNFPITRISSSTVPRNSQLRWENCAAGSLKNLVPETPHKKIKRMKKKKKM